MPPAPILPGHAVWHVRQTASTNALAREAVASGSLGPGAVVVADEQTAGRGRRGRQWFTVPGRSLAASLVLDPPPLPRISRLTVLSSVATLRALEQLGVSDVLIKWPNDLMRGDRKVGGTLTETVRAPDGRDLHVFGVGINLELRPGDLPPTVAALAGDVGLAAGAATRDHLLAAVVREMDAALAEVGTARDAERGAQYRQRSWLTGRLVELQVGGRSLRDHVTAVTSDGDLVLADGTHLAGEHVDLMRVAPRQGASSSAR